MKKKDIIQLVKKLVKEDAYGSATLTTQGAPRTRAVAPAGKDPYTGRVEYPYTVGAKTKNGMMESGPSNNPYYNNLEQKAKEMGIHVNDLMKSLLKNKSEMEIAKMGYQDLAALAGVEDLKEFTSMGQEGIYPRKEEPGDMFQQKEVEELLPNGMASRDDREFQARLKQHADWTEESGYNNTFVHIQYHDSFDREHSYRIHQSQNYNGNYKDFRNPKFTVLTITKKKEGKEEELGRYIVDTDAYLKDFAKLRNDGVLGKQVSEDYKPSHRAYNVIDKSNNDEIVAKELSRDKALEKAHTNPNYMISATDRLAETPMFKTDVKQDMAPKEMAGRIKSVFDKVNGAKDPVQTPEWHKNRFKNKYGISFPESIRNINKDQAIAMNKYANDMTIKEDITDDISKAEDEVAAATQTKADAESKVADARKKKADAEKSSLEENEEISEESMNNADIGILNDLVQKYSPEKLKITIDILSRGTTLSSPTDMMESYIKERGDSNLMEHMDRYRKRATLMEGATEKLFAMFNSGKTNDDVIHHYSLQRIEMPDSFVSKLRKNWEDLRKTKLDLKLADKEAEGFNQTASQTAPGGEMGMEAPMEEKQLASGLKEI